MDVDPNAESFAENERGACDAILAYDPETRAVIERAFEKDLFTFEKLAAIASKLWVKNEVVPGE